MAGSAPMIEKHISLRNFEYSLLLEAIRNFARRRDYVIEESTAEHEHIFTLYDRKPDSPAITGLIDTFVGRSLLVDRLRFTLKVSKRAQSVEIDVRGDVVMSDWNIVIDRPRRRDVIRSETVMEQLVEQLKGLTLQPSASV